MKVTAVPVWRCLCGGYMDVHHTVFNHLEEVSCGKTPVVWVICVPKAPLVGWGQSYRTAFGHN